MFHFIMSFIMFNLLLSNFHVLPELLLLTHLFRHQNIPHVINFNCINPEYEIALQRTLCYHQIRISSLKPDIEALNKLQIGYPRTGMVLNTSCVDWSAIFANQTCATCKSPFHWYIFTEDLNSTIGTLSQFPLEIDSNVMLVAKSKENFELFEFYNTGYYTNGEVVVNNIGYWNSTLQIHRRPRLNLTGVILKTTVVVPQSQKVVDETFEDFVERSRINKQDTLHKLKYFTLLKYLRDMYNFRYVLIRTNSWGYLQNGSFDGMIGSLQRNEADIGGSPVFFRVERAKVVDAACDVWASKPVFIFRHPKHSSGYYSIFTRPLSNRVWICIALTLVTSSVFLIAMFRLKMLVVDGDDRDSSPSLALLTIWSALCQQGYAVARASAAIKLLYFVTFVFTLTIYQYYNATVVSTLLREPPKNIRTSQDLLNSNLKTGVHDVLYNKDFFKHTTDPIAIQIYKQKIATEKSYNFYSLEHGMSMVKAGGFAFLVDNSIAYAVMRNTFVERELCDAYEVVLYPPQNLAAVVRKGSPYKEHFANGLRKMFESGLMHRIKSIWDEPKPACVRTPDTSMISVSVREFSMALAVLAGGAALAAAILVCETLAHAARDPKNLCLATAQVLSNGKGIRRRCRVQCY